MNGGSAGESETARGVAAVRAARAMRPGVMRGPGAVRGAGTLRAVGMLGCGPAGIGSSAGRWTANILAVVGAALIELSALIHLHLWTSGYSAIAVIGPLFLAQGVAGVPLGVAVGVVRRAWLLTLGALLMVGTAVGLLLSVEIGLFGFRDSLAAPYAGLSLVVEFTAAGLLLAGAALILAVGRETRGRAPRRHAEPSR